MIQMRGQRPRPEMRRLICQAAILALCLERHAAAQQAKEPPRLWDAQVGASFVGTSGNSDTSATGADFAFHRRWPVWQIESTAALLRTSDHDASTAERYLGAGRGQRKLSSVIAVSSGLRVERDRFSGIDFRSILDAGLTWALVRAPRWTLDGITGVAWNHEAPVIGSHVNDPVGLLQLASHVALGTTGDATARVTYYSDFSRTSAFRSEVELGAQAAMNNRLALRIGYLLRDSNAPVPGFKTTDSMTTASVVMRWRAASAAP